MNVASGCTAGGGSRRGTLRRRQTLPPLSGASFSSRQRELDEMFFNCPTMIHESPPHRPDSQALLGAGIDIGLAVIVVSSKYNFLPSSRRRCCVASTRHSRSPVFSWSS